MSTTPKKIGWVGLGDQGAPMARAIGEGPFELHVWARRQASLAVLDGVPYVAHETVDELAEASDVLALCLREDTDVEEVLLSDGLLDRLRPGTVVINHGTGLPGFATKLAALGAKTGVEVLDAPVSGGRPGAEARQLTTIVGGDAGVLERVRPVLDSFSRRVALMGGAGSGQTGKLINNALLMMNQQNVQLVLRLADELSLDTQALVDLLLTGTGASFALQSLGGAITEENAGHLSVLQIIDMELFDEAMDSVGVRTPEISARAMQGARDLPEAARLATAPPS